MRTGQVIGATNRLGRIRQADRPGQLRRSLRHALSQPGHRREHGHAPRPHRPPAISRRSRPADPRADLICRRGRLRAPLPDLRSSDPPDGSLVLKRWKARSSAWGWTATCPERSATRFGPHKRTSRRRATRKPMCPRIASDQASLTMPTVRFRKNRSSPSIASTAASPYTIDISPLADCTADASSESGTMPSRSAILSVIYDSSAPVSSSA